MEGGDIVIKMAIEMGREDVINYGPSTCYQDGIKEGALASRYGHPAPPYPPRSKDALP